MIDRMLETTGARDARAASSLSVSVALAGHAAVAFAFFAASYLIVEQVRDPDFATAPFVSPLSVVFDSSQSPRPPRGNPHGGGRGVGAPPARRSQGARPAPPEPMALPPDVSRDADLDQPGPPSFGNDPDGSGLGEAIGDAIGIPGPVGDGGPGPDGNGSTPREVLGEVEPPVLLHRVEPTYPEVPRRARLDGRVVVRAVIGTSGDVEEVEVLRSSNALFDDAAVSAVRRWKYRPARYRGAPVAVYFMVTVTFVLR